MVVERSDTDMIPWRKAVPIISLFLLALLPRVLALNTFITWDEPVWVYRSIHFLTAVWAGDWAGTLLTGHPGVITMWLGSVGVAIKSTLLSPGLTTDLGWVSALPRLDPQDLEALRRIALFLPAAKVPVAVATALATAGVYPLARRLFNPRAAFLGTLLAALDPFFLAHSRVLHLDALMSSLMTLSLLSLLVYLKRGRRVAFLLLSGGMAGLAALNKSPALFLLPFSALLISLDGLNRREVLSRQMRTFLLWAGAAGLIILVLWPALWVDPVGAVQGVLGKAAGYAAQPQETSKFFGGQLVDDPGLWFYPVAFMFRTTPLALLGLAVTLFALLGYLRFFRDFPSRPSGQRRFQIASLGILLAYSVLFGAFLSLGAKKFDRYLLPIFPALDLVAGVGLGFLIELAGRGRATARLFLVGLSVALLFQAGLVFSYHPYYIAYYNPLLGGSSRAPEVLPVGWGEGMDRVAQYLNQQKDAEGLRVASGGMPGLGPLFVGQTVPSTEDSLVTADYVVLYISDWQNESPLVSVFAGEQPKYAVRLHGIDYAGVYRNTSDVAPLDYLRSQTQPGDVILVSGPSLLTKHYEGDAPLYVLAGDVTEAGLVAELNKLAAGHRRVWYVSYPDAPSALQRLARFYLSTQAYKLEQRSFPTTTIIRYLLPDHPSFEALPLEGVSPAPNFSDKLSLPRVGLSAGVAQWGQDLGVVLEWQASGEVAEDYTAFVHLVDEEGRLWGQEDRLVQDDSRQPTSAWESGNRTVERYALPLLAGIPPGKYQVKVGLYKSNTGERLNLLNENGTLGGTAYALGEVQVTPSPLAPSLDDLAIPHSLSMVLGGRLKLLGYGLSKEVIRPGDALALTLFWQTPARIEENFWLLLELKDEMGEIRARGRFSLANVDYSTSRWQAGEVIRGRYDLPIEATASGGEAQLLVSLMNAAGRPVLPEKLLLTTLSVEAPAHSFTIPQMQHPLNASLGERITFLGYDMPRNRVAPGDTLPLTLYWQTERSTETGYTVFIHLLDAQNRIWGQTDNVPVNGTRPTTGWLPGEVIADRYDIPIDPAAPAGEYFVEIGMYDPRTLERLPAEAGGQRLPEDRILLKNVQIEP